MGQSENAPWDEIFQFACGRLRRVHAQASSREDCEDMAQEAVIKVMRAHLTGTLRAPLDLTNSLFRGWLDTILQRIAIDVWRVHRSREFVDVDEALEVDANAKRQVLDSLEVPGLLQHVLLPLEIEVVRLRYWGGLTSAETGAVLDMPAATVRHWNLSALDKLRAHFGLPARRTKRDRRKPASGEV